jgi:RNA polymerase sigma-70 factor (ECF subfamily)
VTPFDQASSRAVPSTPDTEELLGRCAAGESAAVDALLARHRPKLRRMAAVRMDRRLAARLDPSDLVQDVLAEAARRLPRYTRERPLPFYPWLRRLAWDRLIELQQQHVHARRRTVSREVALPDASADALARQIVETETGPAGRLLREEARRRVRAALEGLEPQDREVLVLRHLEQMSVAEIAALLAVSEGAVKMRRLRAIRRLRDALQGDNPASAEGT